MGKSLNLTLGILGGLLVLSMSQANSDMIKSGKERPTETISVHKPYEDKGCKACHSKAKTYEWTSDLCLSCHSEKWAEFSKPYQHLPAIEDCTFCHNPHKSEFEYLLKEEGKILCLTCHESDLKGNRIHSNLKKTCTECHNPHASEYELLLNRGGHDVCLLCHTQDEYNKKELNKSRLSIKECKSCHDKDILGNCCGKEE